MTGRFLVFLYALLVFLLVLVGTCEIAHAQTVINDTIKVPTGGTFEGRIIITAPRQLTWQGETYVGWERTWTITAGVFSATLVPNDTAQPANTSYRVQYVPKSGAPWTEAWVVPTSATPIKVAQIRVVTVPTPGMVINLSQINTAGATVGDCIKLLSPGVWGVGPCGGNSASGKTWAQLTTFTWASLTTTTWSQLQ